MESFNPIRDDRPLSWLRLRPPVPKGRSAAVLERRSGYRLVTQKARVGVLDYMTGGFWHVYHVDMTPRELPIWYELPSKELARTFRADLKLGVQVTDAVKVVDEGITDAWAALEPVVRLPLRQIGRRHGPDDLAAVEEALYEYLTGLTVPQLGLRIVRVAVSVDLEGPDLRREMEKIESQHGRELDELNARHRSKLEKAEAGHRRELREQYERHQQDLEAQRRKLYEGVVGEGLLPKLLLIKLAARPVGSDSKDLDEVIELITRQRVDEFQVPLDMLAKYTAVIERWQLEEPISALLKHLVATYVPQRPQPLPRGPEDPTTVKVGEHEPADTDGERPEPVAEEATEAPADPETGSETGTEPSAEDQDR
ncbi:MAG TPA: hypothetical protein VFU54_15165 [Actinomycetota bacterium]|nr:hypothetical protein [Actinomycetota bacterium]